MAEKRGQRFVAFKFSHSFMRGDEWGVEDLSYNPPEIVRDWHKGRAGRPWRNTKANAEDFAQHLSSTAKDADFVLKGTLSKTQLIHYVNLHREKSAAVQRTQAISTGHKVRAQAIRRAPKRPQASVKSSFRKCDTCSSMYRGESCVRCSDNA